MPESAFEAAETKFNPYHDPRDGRFTFAPPTASTLREAAARGDRKDPNNRSPSIVRLTPLDKGDLATVDEIAATPSVMTAMQSAWAKTAQTGHEQGFFIYKDGRQYYPGEMVEGTRSKLPGLYSKLVRPNPRAGIFSHNVAWFHTHPGDYADAAHASSHDGKFGTLVPGITIIFTGSGFVVGR